MTCDANNNITGIVETYSTGTPPVILATLATDFTFDGLNRLTEHKTTRFDFAQNKNHYTVRNHAYDATGRLAESTHIAYYQGDTPPTPTPVQHVYAGAKMAQNYDGTSYGSPWHWAGAANSHSAPLNSPNPDTASQKGYNIAAMGGKGTPQRRTWQNPTTAGNAREIFGLGRPMAKDSSGNGANWWQGTLSDKTTALGHNVESRFFFEGTVTATDMSRATDAREAGRIGIFGTSNSYGGSYGRVTNEAIGRDLNPLGRGGGQALVGGWLNVGNYCPLLPLVGRAGGSNGNSVNNQTDEESDDELCNSESRNVESLEARYKGMCGKDNGMFHIWKEDDVMVLPDASAYPHGNVSSVCVDYLKYVQEQVRIDIKQCNSRFKSSIRDTCKGIGKCIKGLWAIKHKWCRLHRLWWEKQKACDECISRLGSDHWQCASLCKEADDFYQRNKLDQKEAAYRKKFFDCKIAVNTIESLVNGLNDCYKNAIAYWENDIKSSGCPGHIEVTVIPPDSWFERTFPKSPDHTEAIVPSPYVLTIAQVVCMRCAA